MTDLKVCPTCRGIEYLATDWNDHIHHPKEVKITFYSGLQLSYPDRLHTEGSGMPPKEVLEMHKGTIINVWSSITLCAKDLNTSYATIQKACHGDIPHWNHRYFKYGVTSHIQRRPKLPKGAYYEDGKLISPQ